MLERWGKSNNEIYQGHIKAIIKAQNINQIGL